MKLNKASDLKTSDLNYRTKSEYERVDVEHSQFVNFKEYKQTIVMICVMIVAR